MGQRVLAGLTLVRMETVRQTILHTWPPFSRETSGNSRERHCSNLSSATRAQLPHGLGYLKRMMVRTFRASALGCPACQPGGTARALLAPPAILPPLLTHAALHLLDSTQAASCPTCWRCR